MFRTGVDNLYFRSFEKKKEVIRNTHSIFKNSLIMITYEITNEYKIFTIFYLIIRTVPFTLF